MTLFTRRSASILLGLCFGFLLAYMSFYKLRFIPGQEFLPLRFGFDIHPERSTSLDPNDFRFYNIISEEEALSYSPCSDPKTAASPERSKLSLEGAKYYRLGDIIKARVTILDDYGQRKFSGGDHLRATITNADLQAYAPCVVTDNGNGTHDVVCEAWWRGRANITVSIAYPREAVTALYRIRRQLLGSRYICGTFAAGKFSEETVCHPNHTVLLRMTNQTKLCNLTYYNSGMPFYCGKPRNEHLLCEDWSTVKTGSPYPDLPLTDCENELLQKRGQRKISSVIPVVIHSQLKRSLEPPSIPCSSDLPRLWSSRNPTGFFFNGTWHLRLCKGVSHIQSVLCLRNKMMYIFGDSTTRHWYQRILGRFGCRPITEKWTNDKWHKQAECENNVTNFSAGWYPHSQPFFVGNDVVRYTLYSIARRIDNIPRDQTSIVLIHIYMHFVAFHHSVFVERILIIRRSVEKFVKESPQSKVLIKAPHTYKDTPAGKSRLSDYYAYVYSKILFEAFDGLHASVVLLDNKDATNSLDVVWNHPPENVVDVMIDQMLSYAC